MADYGIFGHGSSGNSWFSRKLNDFHDSTKKYDPIGHYSVENPMKSAHWLVEKTSGGLADAGIGTGFNTRLNQEADENGNNFGLGSQRMGVGIGTVLAAMYGGDYLSGLGGETSSAGAEGGGLMDYGGPQSYFEQGGGQVSFDGAGGMDWFDPNGLPQGSKYASDFPNMKGNSPWWSKAGGLFGMGQQGQGQRQGGGSMRQNLPLYENEKTDQQKLAELLEALQNQQGGY
jgi:hypothetical protein